MLFVLLLLALSGAGCEAPPRETVTLSGKTVWGEMALEGVSLEVWRERSGGWRPAGTAKSGYHGSFRLVVTPGRYRIRGELTIPAQAGDRRYAGELGPVEVLGGVERIDQLVVEMFPAGAP